MTHDSQSRAEDHLAEQLRSQPLTRRLVTMVAQEVDSRGVPSLLVFVRVPARTPIPPGIPSHFEGFRVVVKESGDLVAHGFGSFWSDPLATIISAPSKVIDAAAGGPQQRRRAHAATAKATQTQAQIDAEKAARDAAVAAELTRAQQEVATTTTTAKVAAKKKLIKTLAIGGGAFAVLAVALLLVTGKKTPATLKANSGKTPVRLLCSYCGKKLSAKRTGIYVGYEDHALCVKCEKALRA
jgi:hypothetical protein